MNEFVIYVTINSMNKFEKWRVIDKLQIKKKEEKKKRMKNVKEYLRFRM